VAHQKQGFPRQSGPDPIQEDVEIIQIYTEALHKKGYSVGLSMAAQVESVDGIAMLSEMSSERIIPPAVFRQPVYQDDPGFGFTLRPPPALIQ
jgi:hypothetical protein